MKAHAVKANMLFGVLFNLWKPLSVSNKNTVYESFLPPDVFLWVPFITYGNMIAKYHKKNQLTSMWKMPRHSHHITNRIFYFASKNTFVQKNNQYFHVTYRNLSREFSVRQLNVLLLCNGQTFITAWIYWSQDIFLMGKLWQMCWNGK